MEAAAASASYTPDLTESVAVFLILLLTTILLFSQATAKLRQKLWLANNLTISPSPSTRARRLAPTSSESSNPKGRVLVVDDDPVTRLQLGTRLKRRGFQVTEVCDGREAIELYQQGQRFCLVVMDYEMPDLTGVETIAQIRRRDQNVVVIGSTIHDATQKQQKFLIAGANKVARTKPIMDDEIDELVREYELL